MASRMRAKLTPIKEPPYKGRGVVRNAKLPSAGFAADLVPPLGWVRIIGNAGEQVWAMLGDGKVTVTGGYGGWEQIDRPRKKSITSWQGTPPFNMTVPIRFEGFLYNVQVEDQIALLEQFGRKGQGDQQPPVVRVQLPGGVPRSSKVDWVVENIEWDADVEERDAVGKRIRAAATVSLLEHVSDELIKERAAKSARSKGKGGGKTYTVKKGDHSLKGIAQRVLGDAGRWREIAKLNNIRDQAKLKTGQKLKMPAAGKQVASFELES